MSEINKNIVRDDLRITEREYAEFSDFLRNSCGITLGENKQYLVTTRLRRILGDNKLSTFSELIEVLKKPSNRAIQQLVVDAMTTNETFWFRDNYPFEYLTKAYIPHFSKANPGKNLKIWCAACSTGQEPYSVSIACEEASRTRFLNVNVDILATDVSVSALESARKGRYDKISLVRGLSLDRTKNFFKQREDDSWEVNESIKQRVRFRPMNLQESYFLLGKFDVVFCRNVLIYFSAELKLEIIKKIHGALQPGGILFLGSSESIVGLNDYFEMIHCNPGVAYRAK